MLLVRPNGIERFYTRLLNFPFLPAPKNASALISSVFSHSKQFVPIAFCTEGLVQVIPVVLSRIICYRRTRTIQHKPTSELMVLNIVNHGLASTGSLPTGKWYPTVYRKRIPGCEIFKTENDFVEPIVCDSANDDELVLFTFHSLALCVALAVKFAAAKQ